MARVSQKKGAPSELSLPGAAPASSNPNLSHFACFCLAAALPARAPEAASSAPAKKQDGHQACRFAPQDRKVRREQFRNLLRLRENVSTDPFQRRTAHAPIDPKKILHCLYYHHLGLSVPLELSTMKGQTSNNLANKICTVKASGSLASPLMLTEMKTAQHNFGSFPKTQLRQSHLANERTKMINPKWKTVPCIYMLNSLKCPYGDRCSFAHHEKELRDTACANPSPDESNARYKTEMCKHIQMRRPCPYGDKCRFAHHRLEQRCNGNPEVEKRRKFAHFYSQRWEYPASYLEKIERQWKVEGRNPHV